MRPQFFAGFHRCIAALAGAGNDLIAEHVIEFPAWRRDLARLLAGMDVYLVGVPCDLDEIDRRKRQRGDRRTGQGRRHVVVNRIHTFGPYDLEVVRPRRRCVLGRSSTRGVPRRHEAALLRAGLVCVRRSSPRPAIVITVDCRGLLPPVTTALGPGTRPRQGSRRLGTRGQPCAS